MQTLSYGFLKPQSGDKGKIFFPAMAANIQQLNDHNHNGANSAKLTSASSVAVTQAISAGSWIADGGGTYHQLVTMPGGLLFNDYDISFRTSAGVLLYLSVAKVSANTYNVYINDNSLNLTAVYT